MSTQPRHVSRVVRGMPASDGAGVKLQRVIGQPQLQDLDPFLMLDEFRSDQAGDYIAGFPPHPHRGFETVTYMLAGRMRHGDNQGNTGLLGPGSVQWMTAGRGIVHEEMPEQEDGLMWGFQLWVNLPAAQKMKAPYYQDIPPEQVPEVRIADGVQLRVLAGEAGGATGPVRGIPTEPLYIDVRLAGDREHAQPVPAGHSAFIYIYEGNVDVREPGRDVRLLRGQLAVLEDGDEIRVRAAGGDAKYILVAGKPLREPVAKYGPFVMNTMQEIRQAIDDYNGGRF
ncbi:MAG: pirin family protein [Gammaproteobacteria bacterium]